jgi:hypothetical protein
MPENEKAEEEYCKRIAEGLLAYELNPLNFTKNMRARTVLSRQRESFYSGSSGISRGLGVNDLGR